MGKASISFSGSRGFPNEDGATDEKVKDHSPGSGDTGERGGGDCNVLQLP